MITNLAQAENRVRLLLDRSDSPWVPDTDITEYIFMAINEFVGERVNAFPSNQEIRDDLGEFVKTAVYSIPILEATTTDVGDTFLITGQQNTWMIITEELSNAQVGSFTGVPEIINPVRYSNTGISFNTEMFWGTGEPETLANALIQENNEGFMEDDEGTSWPTLYFTPNVRTVLSLRVESDLDSSYPKEIDIRSIDKFVKIKKDPFNSANEDNYVAVKTGDVYWVSPDVTNTFTQEVGEEIITENKTVVMTYISGNNEEILWLPSHAREEVCQIAARKILSTFADERYESSSLEVKQLKGK